MATPDAAAVSDPRPLIQPGDEKQAGRLLDFLELANKRIDALSSTTPPAGEEWVLLVNDHVMVVLRLLGQLLADLRSTSRSPRFVLRFDMPAGDPSRAAAYEPTTDTIHLQPFTTDAELHKVAGHLVHEYTHVMQDRRTEEELATTLRPVEHSVADELAQEVQGHRNEAYFMRMLALAKLLDGPEQLDMANLTLTALVDDYEELRSGDAARVKVAKRTIDAKIGDIKRDQVRDNSPARHYPVEISATNHALLYLPGRNNPVDLGAIGTVATTFDLRADVERLLRAWSGAKTLFTGPRGTKLTVAMVTVVYGSRRVVQVELRPR
jgi:hypothetical protein